MRKAIVLMAIGILAVMTLVGCTSTPAGGDGSATPPPTLAELQQQINSLSSTLSTLNGRVSNLDSAVAGLGNQQAYDDTALRQSIATLQVSIDALATRVAVLESSPSDNGNDNGNTTETTRWNFKTCGFVDVQGVWNSENEYLLTEADFDFDMDYDRIDEEGLYDIDLGIRYDPVEGQLDGEGQPVPAPAVVTLTNAELELILVPGDYIAVNQDDTYLDSDSEPWLFWDVEFITREREDQEVCRRIIFISDDESLGTISQGGLITMELVLELYYI